jgi:GTP cyclohydrolase II
VRCLQTRPLIVAACSILRTPLGLWKARQEWQHVPVHQGTDKRRQRIRLCNVSNPVAATIRNRVRIPLRFADGFEATADVFSFHGLVDGKEHLALGFGLVDRSGDPAADQVAPAAALEIPLVRIHSECLTGDVFGSLRCDCGPQLREAVELISKDGGYVLYLRQEGRGIGLYTKLDAYRLQDSGMDTFAANRALGRDDDEREYTVAAQMLRALGITTVELLSNNPDKFEQMTDLGINISRKVPTGVHLSEENHDYLAAKIDLHAHTIDLPDRVDEEFPA